MSRHKAEWFSGCMSGTSADGVDAAAILTDGVDVLEFGPSRYRAYSPEEARVIKQAFGRWQGEPLVAEVESVVERAHAELLDGFLPGSTVGFHGQTLAHDPAAGKTHQAGNGQRLSSSVGRKVVWDFRSDDMAAGGQGAPLAPFYHFALARRLKRSGRMAFLNLGGVSNVSIIDTSFDSPDEPGAVAAFDAGPANAIIDDFVHDRTGQTQDDGGKLAMAGTVHSATVDAFLLDPWFAEPPPKSLDRNHFHYVLEHVESLEAVDGAATLTACVVHAVSRSLDWVVEPVECIVVCGGGRHNPVVMNQLGEALPPRVVSSEAIGLDGDMLEAQAFAFLAARVLQGLPTSCPGTTGCLQPTCGGIICG